MVLSLAALVEDPKRTHLYVGNTLSEMQKRHIENSRGLSRYQKFKRRVQRIENSRVGFEISKIKRTVDISKIREEGSTYRKFESGDRDIEKSRGLSIYRKFKRRGRHIRRKFESGGRDIEKSRGLSIY